MKFKPVIRMGKRGDITDFEHDMFVGVGRAGLNMKLLVYWNFHTKTINSYPGSSSGVGENAELVWNVTGQTSLRWQKGKSNSTTLHSQELQNTISERKTPWRSWATAAEDHTICYSCQLQTGKNAYNSHGLIKAGQQKIGNVLLTSFNFSCNIQMVGSEIGINNMKAWIHPAAYNGSSWWCWCNVWEILCLHTPIRFNWASFKCHSLPEYWWWPQCTHLVMDISSSIMDHVIKLIFQTGFWNMTMHYTWMTSTLIRSQSNRAPLRCGWNRRFASCVQLTNLQQLRDAITSVSAKIWRMFPTPYWKMVCHD